MHYTTPAYVALCETARVNGCKVKLSRHDELWGLQIVVPPNERVASWHVAGVLFPDLERLDVEASHLLNWLRTAAPDRRT